MRIDIVFDSVCPWCYVGKRRFDRALRLRPNLKPEIQYRALDKIDKTPNSANSHRLVRLAQTIGAQGKAVDALFAAYFEQGMDIGDPEVLIRLAEDIGIDRQVATTHMLGDGDLNSVFNENARMHRLGVTGVPCYIFDESKAISGAQEPEIIVRMLDMAAAQEAGQPVLQSTS